MVKTIKSLSKWMEGIMYSLVIRFGRKRISKIKQRIKNDEKMLASMERDLAEYVENHPGRKKVAE